MAGLVGVPLKRPVDDSVNPDGSVDRGSRRNVYGAVPPIADSSSWKGTPTWAVKPVGSILMAGQVTFSE